MSKFGSGRLVQMFGTAVIVQVIISGANFFVGFLLIRRTSDIDYGMFVLVQSTITLLIAAQSSWLSGPIAVVAPKKTAEVRRLMVGAIEASQRRFLKFLTLLALVVDAILYFTGYTNALVSAVIVIATFAGWMSLQREYLRSVLMIYSRTQELLRADIVYVIALVVGALIAAFRPKLAVLWAVGAVAAAGWLGAQAARRTLAKDPGWQSGNATPFWRELRPLGLWSAVGAIIYWIFSQSYNYILATRIGLSAVADVNAARLLLMPMFVLTIGVKSLMVPSAARWLSESGIGALLRRLTTFIAGIVVLDLVYIIFVWFARDWLTTDFFHKTIHDRDRLIILWMVISLIGMIRDLFMCALIALEHFKPMAWLTGASAVVSLSIVWIGLSYWGPAAAMIGQIAGESVSLIGVLTLTWYAVRPSINQSVQ